MSTTFVWAMSSCSNDRVHLNELKSRTGAPSIFNTLNFLHPLNADMSHTLVLLISKKYNVFMCSNTEMSATPV